jgi:hypothetical protein
MYYGRQRTFRSPFLGCLLGLLCISFSCAAPADVAGVQNLLKQDRLNDALTAVNGDLKQSSDDVTLRFLKGVILTRLHRLDDAAAIFKDLIKEHPELPEPYNNLAVIYAAEGKYQDARDLLQKAIDTHPSYATAHENLGDIYAKMASQAYNHALQLDEHNKTAKAKLALINNLFSLRRPLATSAPPTKVASTEKSAPPHAGAEQAAPVQKAAPAQAQAPAGAGEAAKAPGSAAAAAAPAGAGQAPAPAPAKSAVTKSEETAAPQPAPAAPKAASAAPAQEAASATPANTPPAGANDAVRRAIDLWVAAWSDKDVDAYLSHYADDFKPDGGMSLRRWKKERKERVGEPAFIKISISKMHIEMKDQAHATARFIQHYQSDTYSDRVAKTLTLEKAGAKWLITGETSN